jgi:hypothetical protein
VKESCEEKVQISQELSFTAPIGKWLRLPIYPVDASTFADLPQMG